MTTPLANARLQDKLTLPCGAVLKNRMAKSAMSDALGDGRGNPTTEQIRLYQRWAQGGVALSFIGEVQGDARYPEKPGNLVLGDHTDAHLLQQLAEQAKVDGAHIWPQIGHAGALSYLPVSQPRGPSALNVADLQCEALSLEAICALPDMYARTAIIAKNMGFTGVHIHAGHGFLLSQFLSPLFNQRTDGYGGSIAARSRLLLEIIHTVRQAVGVAFPIGVRLNSSDQLAGGLTEAEALQVIAMLDVTSVDLIDISGGTYFPGAKSSTDNDDNASSSQTTNSHQHGAYFFDFASQAKALTSIPIMLTGGFKQRAQAAHALVSGTADIIGLARAMVLNPNLANTWLSDAGGDPDYPRFSSNPAGGITAWYTMRLTALGQDKEAAFAMDLDTAIEVYEARDAERVKHWQEQFDGLSSVTHITK